VQLFVQKTVTGVEKREEEKKKENKMRKK